MKLGVFALALIAFATLGIRQSAAADRLQALSYLVGSWHCTYRVGATVQSYGAVFAFTQGGNWLHETDTWSGGGDEGYYTFDPTHHLWTVDVLDSGRGTTVLHGPDLGASKLDLRSVLPNGGLHTVTVKVDATHFTVAATQTTASGSTTSNDRCTKTP